MKIEQVLGLRVETPIALTDSSEVIRAPCDVRFVLEPAARQRQVAISCRIEICTPDDMPYLVMGRLEGGYILRFPDWADFRVEHDGSVIICTPTPGIPVSTVRHLLLGQVLPRSIGLLRDPALHGSAVSRNDEAVGFLGPARCGKSTLALSFARAGWALVGDDCILLHPLRAGVEVMPTGVGARVWPDSANTYLGDRVNNQIPQLPSVAHYTRKLRLDEGVGGLALARHPVRLRQLYVLDPQDSPDTLVSTATLGGQEAFEALLRHVMRLIPTEPERLQAEFEFLTRLLSQASLRRLRFPRTFDQLPAVRAAVEAAVADLPV